MKRFTALLVSLLMLLSLFVGCQNLNEADITACVGEEPETIDPTLVATADGGTYIVHMFEGLTTIDKDKKIVPGAAESWKISEDGLTYTFKLRDAYWSDGKPVKAADFVYSWRRAADPDTASYYAGQMYYIKNGAAVNTGEAKPEALGVKALDDKTFEVTLEAPCPYFLLLTGTPTFFPLREDVISKNMEKWTMDPSTYVTNGPYKLKKWEHDSYIYLERNAKYWNNDKVLPDTIRFLLTADSGVVVPEFKSGGLLYAAAIPSEVHEEFKKDGTLVIDTQLGTRYVSFNINKPPFNDVRVRKAFTLVMDRELMINTAIKGGEKAAVGIVPYGVPDAAQGIDFRAAGGKYYSVKPEDYEANVALAKQLLAEAGYPGGAGFPSVTYLTNDAGSNVKVAEVYQQTLKEKLGITIGIETQEWGTFNKTKQNGEFTFGFSIWVGDYVDPMTFLDLFMTGGQLNDPKFENAQYDSLLNRAKVEQDPAARMALMHQAEDMLMENWAIAPISYITDAQLVSKKLDGVVSSMLGYKYFMWTKVTK